MKKSQKARNKRAEIRKMEAYARGKIPSKGTLVTMMVLIACHTCYSKLLTYKIIRRYESYSLQERWKIPRLHILLVYDLHFATLEIKTI